MSDLVSNLVSDPVSDPVSDLGSDPVSDLGSNPVSDPVLKTDSQNHFTPDSNIKGGVMHHGTALAIIHERCGHLSFSFWSGRM